MTALLTVAVVTVVVLPDGVVSLPELPDDGGVQLQPGDPQVWAAEASPQPIA